MNQDDQSIRRIKLGYIFYLLGMLLIFTSYSAARNLQSSVNIKDGLGTMTVTATYASAVLFAVFCTPVLVRKFGAKKCMVACESAYAVYLLANLYPEFYTLIPAAVLFGIGEAVNWTCMGMMNAYFAKKYSEIYPSSTKEYSQYVNLFSGYFFTMNHLGRVLGNLVSYVIIHVFNKKTFRDVVNGNFSNVNATTSMTSSVDNVSEFYYCGSRDCQDPDVVNQRLEQYVPTDKLTLDILFGTSSALCTLAVLLHFIFLPRTSHSFFRSSAKASDVNVKFSTGSQEELNISDTILKEEKNNNVRYKRGDSVALTLSRESTTQFIKRTLRDMFLHLRSPKQLLVLPLVVYNGMTTAFVLSEISRAYTSCILGVAMVGIHMIIFGSGNAILSFIVGKYRTKIGRNSFFAFALILDIGNYLFCLLWIPNLDSSWTLYVLFLSFGITQGTWNTLANALHLEYWPQKLEIASNFWTMFFNIGLTIQFAWSGSLCVYTKVYVQTTMMIIGMICYGCAEYLHQSSRKLNSRTNKKTITQ